MPKRTRATLNGKWWKAFFASIKNCYGCGGMLARIFVRAEGANRHVCVDCGKITYLNPKVVAGAIPVDRKGRILLLTRAIEPAKGFWTFPAGFQEMGESVEVAAARETFEESGAEVAVGGLVGIYSYNDAGVVTIVYEARVKARPKPAPGPEALELKFFDPKEIPWKDLAFRSTKDALKDWVKIRRKRL